MKSATHAYVHSKDVTLPNGEVAVHYTARIPDMSRGYLGCECEEDEQKAIRYVTQWNEDNLKIGGVRA